MPSAKVDLDAELDALVASCYDDPLRFCRAMFPWGEKDTPLEHETGPDAWQAAFLDDIGRQARQNAFDGSNAVTPIRGAVSSGHGVGKTACVAWVILWIMSTRPNAQGSVTANTITQLQTKTWAALQRWTKLALTGPWFTINADRMYFTSRKEAWFCSCQSSKEENSEAFAGQHAKDSTSFYIFDEASAIPEGIFQVAEGGLTDGEPMVFLFGNCTRSVGSFHRACFGAGRDRWHPVIVDSRESKLTNKGQIAEWLQDYGEDSDFFRVRVRGLPPRASDAQFIDHQRVLDAQAREVYVLPDEPLVAGADLAWGGEDENVIRFRRGADAKSIPPIRIRGEFTRDPSVLTARLAEVLSKSYDGKRVHTLFLDSAGIAGPIGSRLRQLGHANVVDVNFGADSPDPQCRYTRDHIWQRMKEWLIVGAIDKSPDLEIDLTGPGFRSDTQQRVWLESKKDMKARGLDSPDDADALALTFYASIPVPRQRSQAPRRPSSAWS